MEQTLLLEHYDAYADQCLGLRRDPEDRIRLHHFAFFTIPVAYGLIIDDLTSTYDGRNSSC